MVDRLPVGTSVICFTRESEPRKPRIFDYFLGFPATRSKTSDPPTVCLVSHVVFLQVSFHAFSRVESVEVGGGWRILVLAFLERTKPGGFTARTLSSVCITHYDLRAFPPLADLVCPTLSTPSGSPCHRDLDRNPVTANPGPTQAGYIHNTAAAL